MKLNRRWRSDSGLLKWATAFIGTAEPVPTDYGLSVEQMAEYRNSFERFRDALAACDNPNETTRTLIILKNEAAEHLRNGSRGLVAICEAWPMMTDAKRSQLDIPIRDRVRTPTPPPSEQPQVEVLQAVGHTLRVRVRNGEGGIARPGGSSGATVYYHVGALPPQTVREWRSAGLWTSKMYDVTLPPETPAGATVWLSAAYYNRKGEHGPLARPVPTNVPGLLGTATAEAA